MNVMLLTMLCALNGNPDVNIIRTLQMPAEYKEATQPFSMATAPSGRLFLVDMVNTKILIFDKEGKFIKAFGTPGNGPGEMSEPAALATSKDELYVWDWRRRVSIFDHDGNFKRFFKSSMRNSMVFHPVGDKYFLSTRKITQKGERGLDPYHIVERLALDGENIGVVEKWRDTGILAPAEGINATVMKAFRPDVDIQRDGYGNVYFGFSEFSDLHKMSPTGEVTKIRYDLPTSPPSESEIEAVKSMTWDDEGDRMSWSDLPNIKISFKNDKAYFSQFVIKGDKVAFILTPLGGLDGNPRGYSWGTYYVAPLKGGKASAVGRFKFSEDSILLANDGRIVACVLNDDYEYDYYEVALKGL